MWTADIIELTTLLDAHAQAWLQRPYRLADALRRVCQQLQVTVVHTGEGSYLDDEQAVLGDNELGGYQREVFLVGDGVPFCFARTVMPLTTYQQFQQQFDTLNSKLLGEQLLYPNQTVRSAFEYSVIDTQHPYFDCCGVSKTLTLPARRSQFFLEQQFPLLITEVFLPAIPHFQEADSSYGEVIHA